MSEVDRTFGMLSHRRTHSHRPSLFAEGVGDRAQLRGQRGMGPRPRGDDSRL